MNLKSQKGFTGMDVTAAIMIVTIFSAIIATLYQNYSISSKRIERKAEAVEYAIEKIEEVKSNTFKYFDEENAEKEVITEYDDEDEIAEGFKRTTKLVDYASMEGNNDKQKGYVKNVLVTVEYKTGNKEEKVELSTVIAKEK